MKEIVRKAYLEIPHDPSPDVVVANPVLNDLFIKACRSLGLVQPAVSLNLSLLNLRKTGALTGIRRSKKVTVENQDEYVFASEMAIRHLECESKTTLDNVLCDPLLAARFDEVAARIAPGYTSFQYRWAALNLRKRQRLRPELLSRVVAATAVFACKVTDLKIEEVPAEQGLYLFFGQSGTLYVGECQSIRKRLAKHLEHSDNKLLARWLWERGVDDLHIEYRTLAPSVTTRIRKAMEVELIQSRKPLFNVIGALRND
jgi:site-specific DNA-methyltransferase (adenine-specific)